MHIGAAAAAFSLRDYIKIYAQKAAHKWQTSSLKMRSCNCINRDCRHLHMPVGVMLACRWELIKNFLSLKKLNGISCCQFALELCVNFLI
jgi:hypothetical protein